MALSALGVRRNVCSGLPCRQPIGVLLLRNAERCFAKEEPERRRRSVDDFQNGLVSPDAGWAVLGEYLSGVSDLDIGMYDLTAPHIVTALEAIGQQGGVLDLCLGPKASLGSGTKAEDIPEADVKAWLEAAFGERFRFAWASVGGRKQFPSAYHIKVAVRDERAQA